ncbi:MAG: glycosyltransferase family 4 protein [Planctomycetaceae bacterium]|nr:glycosyltransferase family 4 protein [Planctomycetaceae bacterium]MCL2305605.1 glycosyltransferase family 4 protein [Planctomycetaceae bacterium]
MKITYLCEYGSINGAEKSLLAVLRLLPNAEFSFRIVAPPTGPFAAELNRLEIPHMDWPDDFSGLTLAEKRCHLEKILREHSTDLVHANSLSMGRLSGPVLKALKIPGFAHLRDIIRLSRAAIDDLNQHVRLFAVSQAVREFHVQQGIEPAKCVTLYNGVDLQEFRPKTPTQYLHRELGIPAEARLLGCIGQIGMRKGQDVLLDAVEPILEPLDLHLVLVGERFSGKDEAVRFENNLRSRASSRVHFLGIRNDIPDLLPELVLLVHPARQEPLGRVLLESLACGVAVIATDVGGTSEILPCRSQLILPNDPGELRQKLITVLEDDAWRREISVESRKIAESRFSDTDAVERLIRQYRRLRVRASGIGNRE